MEDCEEHVQEMLFKMGYRTLEMTEKRGNVNNNNDYDMDMVGVVDEEVLEDVYYDRDEWYGRMINVLQPTLVRTNFRFPSNAYVFFSTNTGMDCTGKTTVKMRW